MLDDKLVLWSSFGNANRTESQAYCSNYEIKSIKKMFQEKFIVWSFTLSWIPLNWFMKSDTWQLDPFFPKKSFFDLTISTQQKRLKHILPRTRLSSNFSENAAGHAILLLKHQIRMSNQQSTGDSNKYVWCAIGSGPENNIPYWQWCALYIQCD